MGNNMKKRKYVWIVVFVVIITGSFTFQKIMAEANKAGSMEDPLVTKSYVDMQIKMLSEKMGSNPGGTGTGNGTSPINMTEIYNYVDNKIKEVVQNGVNVSDGFVVVEVQAGQKLIGKEGTELIVRSGEAVVIANEAGDGLSDVTTGVDLKGGYTFNSSNYNHLLIVPRSDGRGLSVVKKSYILVKGDYTLE